MARMLIAALERAGHAVTLASRLRAYVGDAQDRAAAEAVAQAAAAERDRIAAAWRAGGPPDLWVCYHPYYKAPDHLGPPLCRAFGLRWVTVEASLSARRDVAVWAGQQDRVRDAVAGAALNVALTRRDLAGLVQAIPGARVAHLPPFIDAAPAAPAPEPGHLVTVAMMRPGDKLDSYRALAAVLAGLADLPWRLTVAGDGPSADAVRAALAPLGGRVTWAGALDAAGVAALMATGWAYVWPGVGEAYGLAYLEAQAAGLPVAAWATHGVPEVVAEGETGLLAPAGDVAALAGAVRRLLTDGALRARLAAAAPDRVAARHSLAAAAAQLDGLLRRL